MSKNHKKSHPASVVTEKAAWGKLAREEREDEDILSHPTAHTQKGTMKSTPIASIAVSKQVSGALSVGKAPPPK